MLSPQLQGYKNNKREKCAWLYMPSDSPTDSVYWGPSCQYIVWGLGVDWNCVSGLRWEDLTVGIMRMRDSVRKCKKWAVRDLKLEIKREKSEMGVEKVKKSGRKASDGESDWESDLVHSGRAVTACWVCVCVCLTAGKEWWSEQSRVNLPLPHIIPTITAGQMYDT